MLDAVDAYVILGDKVPSNRLCVLAPLDRRRSFARVLSLQVLEKGGVKRGASHFRRPFSLPSGIGSLAYYNRARDVRGILRCCAPAPFSPSGVGPSLD
jgi:hypothetical protein